MVLYCAYGKISASDKIRMYILREEGLAEKAISRHIQIPSTVKKLCQHIDPIQRTGSWQRTTAECMYGDNYQ